MVEPEDTIDDWLELPVNCNEERASGKVTGQGHQGCTQEIGERQIFCTHFCLFVEDRLLGILDGKAVLFARDTP